MSTHVSASTDRVKHLLFGDSGIATDWVSEAPIIIPLMLLDVDEDFLSRYVAARFTSIGPAMSLALEPLEKKEGEAKILASAIDVVDTAIIISTLESSAAAGLMPETRATAEEFIDRAVASLWQQRNQFRQDYLLERSKMELEAIERLEHVVTCIKDGLQEESTERTTLLREARKGLTDLLAETVHSASPMMWLILSWVTWQLTMNEDEARGVLEACLGGNTGMNRPSFGLAARFGAYLMAVRGESDLAYNWACTACKVWPTPGAFAERVRYSVLSGRIESLNRDLTELFDIDDAALVVTLGDPVLNRHRSLVLEVALAKQSLVRMEAKKKLVAWNSTIKKIEALTTELGKNAIPFQLISGANDALARVDSADLITVRDIDQRAAASKSELMKAARGAAQLEKKKRNDAVEALRKAVDSISGLRDNAIQNAIGQRQTMMEQARLANGDVDALTRKAQKGCTWGMGSGCMMFLIYAAIAVVLSIQGLSVGPETIFGKIALFAAGIPVIMATFSQIGFLMRRAGLDKQVAARVVEAKAAFDQMKKDIEEKYREQDQKLRERLKAEEAALERLNKAIANLG